MNSKLAWVALLALWLATFGWMNDLEHRQRINGAMDRAIFQAQQEVLGLYAKAINQQTDILMRVLKADSVGFE